MTTTSTHNSAERGDRTKYFGVLEFLEALLSSRKLCLRMSHTISQEQVREMDRIAFWVVAIVLAMGNNASSSALAVPSFKDVLLKPVKGGIILANRQALSAEALFKSSFSKTQVVFVVRRPG